MDYYRNKSEALHGPTLLMCPQRLHCHAGGIILLGQTRRTNIIIVMWRREEEEEEEEAGDYAKFQENN